MSEEYFVSGHDACQGSGIALATRWIAKAAAKQKAVIVCSFGKLQEFSNNHPYTSWRLPILFAGPNNFVDTTLGVMVGTKNKVLSIASFEETFHKNLQSIKNALEKKKNLTIICYDDVGNAKKALLMKKIGFKYVATASINDVKDIYLKTIKSLEKNKPSYVQILTPCPLDWGLKPENVVKAADLAVKTNYYPIIEYDNNKLNIKKNNTPLPVEEFLKIQKRFKQLTKEEIAMIQRKTEALYYSLLNST